MTRVLNLLQRTVPGIAVIAAIASPLAIAQNALTIQNTAVRSMLMDELFVDQGKYHLLRSSRCQFAYLESPVVVISRGRVRIRARLTGQLGVEVPDGCAGPADTFDVTVSGRPYFSGENLGLADIRIDQVSNPMYRAVLQQFVDVILPSAIEVNLRQGVQQLIDAQKSSYEVTVSKLVVTDIAAENNQIQAELRFAVSAQ